MNDSDKGLIKQYRMEGKGYKDISMLLDLSVNTVKSYCKRYAIPGANMTEKTAGIKRPLTTGAGVCRQCGRTLECVAHHRKRVLFRCLPTAVVACQSQCLWQCAGTHLPVLRESLRTGTGTVVRACSPAALYVENAGASSEAKSGTPPTDTERPSGAATENMKAPPRNSNVQRHM